MSAPIVTQFMVEAKQALAKMAEESMRYPKSDPFEHGVQCGKWQGVEFALGMLDDILRDKHEEERSS